MDVLIEFIVQNIFFVAIVIGGLISMFNRMSGNGQQEEQKRSQRQQRPVQKQEKVDWREIFRQEEADTKPARPRQPTFAGSAQSEEEVSRQATPVATQVENGMDNVLGEQQELQERYEQARLRKEEASRKIRQERTNEGRSDGEHSRTSGSLDLQLNRLSSTEAMKAVVWAEVLGRPRARQPHSTFARKR